VATMFVSFRSVISEAYMITKYSVSEINFKKSAFSSTQTIELEGIEIFLILQG
jgi:hypothetical protein